MPGIMGKSMCGHLLDKGYAATVYSRTISKCEALVCECVWVDSASDLMRWFDGWVGE